MCNTCTKTHVLYVPVYLYSSCCTPIYLFLYTCILVHLYTCIPVHLYTCTCIPVYLYNCCCIPTKRPFRSPESGAPGPLAALLEAFWGSLGAVLALPGRRLAVSCFRPWFRWPLRLPKPILADFGRLPESAKQRSKTDGKLPMLDLF